MEEALRRIEVIRFSPLRNDTLEWIRNEFPQVIATAVPVSHGRAVARASTWKSQTFDTWAFDAALDTLSPDEPLAVIDDEGDDRLVLEVLNRAQRAFARRNDHSSGLSFDVYLRAHRVLHDLSKPLVRADFNHATDVWQWLLRIAPDAPRSLQLAALFHDIERLDSEADARIEHLAADYQEFKNAHAHRGAGIAEAVLRANGADAALANETARLIARHEVPSNDEPLALLNDADALSFFSLNSDGYANYFGPEQTERKVSYTLNRLRPVNRQHLRFVRLRREIAEQVRASS